MQKLGAPDLHHLDAAIGWLGLGLPGDALAELHAIAPGLQNHPDVLEVRWELFAREQNWAAALRAAEQLVADAPQRASGWLHRAYAVRRAPGGDVAQAQEVLLPAAEKFSDEPTIFYNLACYACQLGNLDAARGWLERALAVAGKVPIQAMALADDDLLLLRAEIEKW